MRGNVSLHYSGEGQSRVIKIKIGPGAGYVGGYTLAVGYKAKDQRLGGNMYKRRMFQIYAGHNANRVPYAA